MNSSTKKDTIYIEADDEITLVIDKVLSTNEKVVALVLPKRAAVFQSIVNMKLLKKSAIEAKKSLVIISSDEAIKNMAAVAGVHIAHTLNSKPSIPKLSEQDTTATVAADEISVQADTKSLADSQKKNKPKKATNEKVKMDDKKSSFKIPDFSSFRFKLGLAIACLTFLAVGWVFGFVILPRATVTIVTNVDRAEVAGSFNAKANLENSELETNSLKATKVETSNEESVTVKATGEKDVGEKATGTITITNCSTSQYAVIEGDRYTKDGQAFAATENASVAQSSYSFTLGGFKCDEDGKSTVSVVAVESGVDSNISEGSHAIDGSPNNVFAWGSNMSGGTTELVIVLSQADINSAKGQLAGTSESAAREELINQINQQSLIALDDTLEQSEPVDKFSASVGDEVDEVIVTRSVSFSMLGVTIDDVSGVLEIATNELLTNDNLKIRSNGLTDASYSVANKLDNDSYEINVKTVATIGPEFDIPALKQEVAGLKRGEIESLIEAREGVRSVTVEYSPFWIFSTPSSTNKIEIVVNEDDS